MKKIYLLLATALPAALSANAEVLLNESFGYDAGNLNSQGVWVSNGYAGTAPICVVDGSLTREGYQTEVVGKMAQIGMDMGKNSVQAIFAPKDKEAVTAPVYYSALVRVDAFPSSLGKPGAIIALTGANASTGDFGDAMTGSEGGGLFVKKGATDGMAVMGVSRNSSTNGVAADQVVWADKEIAVGDTALVVVKYQKTDGDGNDEMWLWINPADENATPDAVVEASSAAAESLFDIRGIALCQRSALTSKIPQVTVDELRVGTEWADIFSGSKTPVATPNITLSENPVNFGQAYCNITLTRSVVVKATDLTADITIGEGKSGQVTLSAYTIPKDAAMSPEGFTLEISLTPVESNFFSDKFTFSSEGANDRVLSVEWHSVSSVVANTLRELCDEDTHNMTSVYVYKGEATVTFVETYYDAVYDRMVNSIFAEDATAGVELRSATGCGYDEVDIEGISVGDNLTDIVGYLIFGDDGLTMVPRTAKDWRVVSSGNTVEPIDVNLRDMALADDGYVYGNRLVRVSGVTFPDKYLAAGDYYGLWNSQKYEIYDGTLDEYEGMAWMWCNKGADYFKTSTEGYFDHQWTMTGFVNSHSPVHISPRSKADMVCEGPKPDTAIDAPEADEAEGVLYDLQGRRAGKNPSAGIYILRSADGSVKKIAAGR